MFLIPLGDEEVEKIVTALNPNKSTELDGMSVKILKSLLPILPHLTGLINRSFFEELFQIVSKKHA